MKKSIILFAAVLLFSLDMTTQIKAGIKVGIASDQIEKEDIFINNLDQFNDLGIAIQDASYGIQAGFFVQAKIGRFFIQPEFIFNSNSIDYAVSDFANGEIFESIKSESYQHLDIPVMLGWKLGPLRLQGGPVGHVFLNSTSELFDISGYDQKFNEFTWGYQTGVGLDLWKFTLDARYEGNFNNLGDQFSIGNQDFAFSQTPSRVIFSLGYKFGRK